MTTPKSDLPHGCTTPLEAGAVFDLTYNLGPCDEHQMDVCSVGLNILRSHLMQLAQTSGLYLRWAEQRLDGMVSVLDRWADLIVEFDIRRTTPQDILQAVQKQGSLFLDGFNGNLFVSDAVWTVVFSGIGNLHPP